MAKRILFVGGGTSGHISPLLAVMSAVIAEATKQGVVVELHYVGSPADITSPLIKGAGFPLTCHSLESGKLHRFLTLDQLRQTSKLFKGLVMAKKLVGELQPDVVFAKGGAVSVPVVLAATRLGIPIFSHETDVVPGLANRFISRYASTIFTAYPAENYKKLTHTKTLAVGQPVRSIFYSSSSKNSLTLENRILSFSAPLVVVIGGSQGAERLNSLVAGAWPTLLKEAQLVHITGSREQKFYLEKRQQLSESEQEKLWVLPFIGEELATIFQHSTVAISRAGGTIAELAATATPTVLVPLPTAAQNHQLANARMLEKAGAAVVLQEAGLSSAKLAEAVTRLLTDTAQRAALSENIREFDHPDAAAVMARLILKSIAGS